MKGTTSQHKSYHFHWGHFSYFKNVTAQRFPLPGLWTKIRRSVCAVDTALQKLSSLFIGRKSPWTSAYAISTGVLARWCSCRINFWNCSNFPGLDLSRENLRNSAPYCEKKMHEIRIFKGCADFFFLYGGKTSSRLLNLYLEMACTVNVGIFHFIEYMHK